MNSSFTKKCFKSQRPKLLESFFRLYFCCLLDQDLKGPCRQKNWAVLRWFLPYFKEKTALKLNKTETLKPGEKNAHVILFTHGRAKIKILFIFIQGKHARYVVMLHFEKQGTREQILIDTYGRVSFPGLVFPNTLCHFAIYKKSDSESERMTLVCFVNLLDTNNLKPQQSLKQVCFPIFALLYLSSLQRYLKISFL